jgi:hypothetical protein
LKLPEQPQVKKIWVNPDYQVANKRKADAYPARERKHFSLEILHKRFGHP